MSYTDIRKRIHQLEEDLRVKERRYLEFYNQTLCYRTEDPTEAPSCQPGYHLLTSYAETVDTGIYQDSQELQYVWVFVLDGFESVRDTYGAAQQALEELRSQVDSDSANLKTAVADAAEEAAHQGRRPKQVPTWLAKVEAHREAERSHQDLDETLNRLLGVTNYAALPDTNELAKAYWQGMNDRLNLGGRSTYSVLDDGQVRLETYIEDVASRIRAGYAPGTSSSSEEAQRAVSEELELALKQGVVFQSVEDIARFAVDLAGAAYRAIRSKRAPKGHPVLASSKPQDLRKRSKRYTDADTIAEIAAHKQSILEKYIK